MDEKLMEAFEALKLRYGTHSTAAMHLGITIDHYCALRNGRANIPQRTADYILLKAKEAVEDMPDISSTAPAIPHEPAQAAHP